MLLLIATPSKAPSIPRACTPPHDKYNFCDLSLPLADRVSDLISRLHTDEKPPLLTARQSPLGNVSRLGIPEYDWGANCIHGVQSRCSADGNCPTSFPNPNVLGNSFNRSIWRGMGAIMGLELRALWLQGVSENHRDGLPHLGLDCWSPNIGIVRDPRWGRNLETPSEDPLMCGTFGTLVTRGLQEGTDERYLQAVVTLKHFDANSLEGPWGPGGAITRHSVDANISRFDLASSYLPAFKMAVETGKAAGIMCSYNAINGVPSCANKWLLQTTLRGEWGFDGYVTSDSGAVRDIYQHHHYTRDGPSGVTAALDAGCDIDSSLVHGDHATGSPYTWYIAQALKSGALEESSIDAALTHSLMLRFRLGLFDPINDQPYWHVPPAVVGSAAHVAASLDATRQGLVLLQNGHASASAASAAAASVASASASSIDHASSRGSSDSSGSDSGIISGGVLPLRLPSKVAVVGPHANDHEAILGNYLGQICPDHYASTDCVQTPYEAIASLNQRAGSPPSHTVNASGIRVNSTDASGMAAAVAAAKAADVIVYVGGLDGTCERESRDRYEVGLPGLQPTLLAALVKLGKPTVLVLFHGGMLTLPPSLLAAPNLAVISAGYPGVHGAPALADALFDTPTTLATNRFGLTPVTWYSESGWRAAKFNMLSFDMTAAPGRTYRYYRGAESAQWPFGHGLSYAELQLSAHVAPSNASVAVVSVRNADGQRAADAVVLAFIEPMAGTLPPSVPAAQLVRQLVAFERLGPIGATTTASVEIPISPRMVTLHDADGKPALYAGAYALRLSTAGTAGGQLQQPTATLTMSCDKDACRLGH